MPAHTVARLAYRTMTRHQGDARYELAVLGGAPAGPLIVADARPVLILAGTPYHPLVTPQGLAAAVRAGRVHYVLVSSSVSSTRSVRRQKPEARAWADVRLGEEPRGRRQPAGRTGRVRLLYLLHPGAVRAGRQPELRPGLAIAAR